MLTTEITPVVESPTARVWEVAFNHLVQCEPEQLPSRSAVIKECESEGINHFTARTQYQRWYRAVLTGEL